MEELKQPLIDRSEYDQQEEESGQSSPDLPRNCLSRVPLLVSNLSLFNEEDKAGRQSLRNHLQRVDDSDTDSVIKQMLQDSQQVKANSSRSNRMSTLLSTEKRQPTSKIEAAESQDELAQVTESRYKTVTPSDMKTGGAMVGGQEEGAQYATGRRLLQQTHQSSSLRNLKSVTKKVYESGKEGGPQEGLQESNELQQPKQLGGVAFLKRSTRVKTDEEANEVTSEYSFNDTGDQTIMWRRFKFLWPVFWLVYYLFCCCLCQRRIRRHQDLPSDYQSKRKNSKGFIQDIQSKLKKLKNKNFHDKFIYETLRQIKQGKSEGIRNLKKVRINPDFTQTLMIREDLEFFLPQICCLYLNSGSLSHEDEKKLFDCLVQMSRSSFHFAHRIFFFINSGLYSNSHHSLLGRRTLEKQKELMIAVEGACINGQELLYLSNSQMILESAHSSGFTHLYPLALRFFEQDSYKPKSPYQKINDFRFQGEQSGANTRKPSELQGARKTVGYQPPTEILNSQDVTPSKEKRNHRPTFTQSIAQRLDFGKRTKSMEKFKPNQRQTSNHDPQNTLNQLIRQEILNKKTSENSVKCSLDISLSPYGLAFDFTCSNLDRNDYCIKAFFSTLNFLKDLTELSQQVLGTTQQPTLDKMSVLKQGLQNLNKQLPASVYLPFVNQSTRNYAVLNICPDESRLFLTKERAPFMLCIEIFRPEEINFSLKEYKELVKNQVNVEASDTDHFTKPRVAKETFASRKTSLFSKSPQKQQKKLKKEFDKFVAKLDQEISKSVSVGQFRRMTSSLEHENLGVQNELFDIRKLSLISDSNTNQQQLSSEGMPNAPSQVIPQGKTIDKGQEQDIRGTTAGTIRQSVVMSKAFETDQEDYRILRKEITPFTEQLQQLGGPSIVITQAQEFQDPFHNQLIDFQMSPQLIPEKKNSMVSALNDYLRQSNDQLADSQERMPGMTRQRQQTFKEEYSFYQNLDQVTDDEHFIKSQRSKKEKSSSDIASIGKRALLDRQSVRGKSGELMIIESNQEKSQNTVSNRDSKSNNEDYRYDEDDIEKGAQRGSISGPLTEYPVINGAIQENVKATTLTNWQMVDVEQNFLFSETCEQQEERVRRQSEYGSLKTWKLMRLIVKSGDDLRQEQFAMQVISLVDQLFKAKKLKCKLRPYEIVATGQGCGVIEFLTDTLSIDFIKRKIKQFGGSTLLDYYLLNYGRKGDKVVQARKNFCYSMAAYSLICYILQVKDRHNANILIDKDGYVVHIDFGFLLTHAPGKTFKVERAPFKLTQEFMQVMGGQGSQGFRRFRTHLIEGFKVIHHNADKIMVLIEMIALAQQDLPCFRYGTEIALNELRKRLQPLTKKDSDGKYVPKLMTKGEIAQHIDQLIFQSYEHWGTNVYDRWQYCCQGIF